MKAKFAAHVPTNQREETHYNPWHSIGAILCVMYYVTSTALITNPSSKNKDSWASSDNKRQYTWVQEKEKRKSVFSIHSVISFFLHLPFAFFYLFTNVYFIENMKTAFLLPVLVLTAIHGAINLSLQKSQWQCMPFDETRMWLDEFGNVKAQDITKTATAVSTIRISSPTSNPSLLWIPRKTELASTKLQKLFLYRLSIHSVS